MLAEACAFRPLAETRLRLVDGGSVWFGGYCRFSEQWTNHPHRHPLHHELCLVLDGEGEFVHGGGLHRLRPGSLFVSGLDVVHEIRSPRSRDLALVFIAWAPGAGGRLLAEAAELAPLLAFQRGHRIHRADQAHLASLLPALHAEGPDGAVDAWRRASLLLSLLTSGLAALADAPLPAALPPPDPLHRAQHYIRRHLTGRIEVAAIAAEAGIGERQLRRLFRRHLGRTVVQAVVDERLREATRHLVMHFPVAEVAQRVGIGSASMFCRLFKQRYGQSPGCWQDLHAPRGGGELAEFGR